VEELRERGIHLEVCPTSNLQTGICESHAEHPIDRLCRAGLSVSVNTDARAVTDVTLSEEYRRLARAFGWTRADFLRRNLDALDAAFAPADLKARLRERLVAGYAGTD